MEVEVKANTMLRDERGRFLGKIKAGVEEMFIEMSADGRAHAEAHQPSPGRKPDPRSAPISASFYNSGGTTAAVWGNTARHARAVEEGTRRHFQSGRVSFYWERYGRYWKSGANPIDHPATDAQPFLRPSFYHVANHYKDYLRRHLG